MIWESYRIWTAAQQWFLSINDADKDFFQSRIDTKCDFLEPSGHLCKVYEPWFDKQWLSQGNEMVLWYSLQTKVMSHKLKEYKTGI